jgi:hypothetical protein
MAEFISIISSFPTVVFTVALVLASLYWALAVVGAVDLEVFDLADGALDGAVDGALEGAMDGALDGAMDGAAEGAVDGALDGATEGTEVPVSGGALLWLANVLRLGRVPVTVSLSAFALWGWVAGFLLTWLFRAYDAGWMSHLVFSVVAMVACVAVSAALTNVSVRPLEPVFRPAPARERASLVGEVCEITTSRVDLKFGQATLQLGTDHLVVQVRCETAGALGRGDSALIVHFDPRHDAFVVEPLQARRGGQPTATRAQNIHEG